MKLVIKEESKNKLLFSIDGGDHAVANVLKEELWEDAATTAAGYSVSHPLVGIPEFVVETNGKKNGRKIVEEAIKRAEKKIEGLLDGVKSLKV